MQAIKFQRTLLAVAVATLAMTWTAVAGETSEGSSTNTLQTTTAKEFLYGRDSVTRAYVNCGKKTFTFVVPVGYRVDASNPAELMLVGPGFSNFITLHVVGPAVGEAALAAETFRGTVNARYQDAQIVEEFSLSAGGAIGPAFEVRGRGANGLARTSRVAFIRFGGQILEFCLTANPEKYNSSIKDLQMLMLTFRVSDAGSKPDIAVLSDRI